MLRTLGSVTRCTVTEWFEHRAGSKGAALAFYKMLPRIALAWRDVAVAALGTAALFTLGKAGIGAYIGNSGVADSFGAAGSLIALLLWVYYSAQVFFLGAEFARQYALQLGSLRQMYPPY